MDGFTLVAHVIWASVVAGTTGYFLRTWRKSLIDDRAHLRLYTVETAAKNDRDALMTVAKEVGQIREGLEKLKAIPPKQPRL